MQRILSKRVLRDIRENLLRYLALFFLVALVMYMVVAIVGAAETIMQGTKESGRVHHRGIFPWIFIWDSPRFVSIRQEKR